jgi:hypothetical protein
MLHIDVNCKENIPFHISRDVALQRKGKNNKRTVNDLHTIMNVAIF